MMNEAWVNGLIDKRLNSNLSDNQFGVSKIPAHTHNGTDSLKVDPNDLTNSSLYFATQKTTISSDQLLLLHGTPVIIVPSVGVTSSSTTINAFSVVEGISAKLYYGGTQYAGTTTLQFRYTNASGVKVSEDMPNSFLVGTATAYQHISGTTTVFTPVTNAPVVVSTTSPLTAGNSYIVILTKYRTVSL